MAGHGPLELWRNVQGYFITRRTAHPTKTNTLTISLFFFKKNYKNGYTWQNRERPTRSVVGACVWSYYNHLFICTTLCRLKNYILSYYVSHIYRIGELAQMVERPLCMREVSGSIPGFSNWCPHAFIYSLEKACLVKYWQSISFVNFNIWLFQLSLATV